MAKAPRVPKPANQGSAGKVYTQAPKGSSKPSRNAEPAQTDQSKRRGIHVQGTHGTRKP